MKIKVISIFLIAGIAFAILISSRCSHLNTGEKTGAITPASLPVIVPGFHFPEDSTVIYGWLNDTTAGPGRYDSASIYRHAWGIWAGLTDTSGQSYGGDQLLVFETWMGLNEVRNAIINNTSCDSMLKSARTALTRPKQFEHAARFAQFNAARLAYDKGNKAGIQARPVISAASSNQWVTVSYSPDAACFAISNKLFNMSVINRSYNPGGQGQITGFPQKTVTIKPTYLVYQVPRRSDSLLQMPVWLNAPDPPGAVQVDNFPYCVYIDITNSQTSKHLIPALPTDTNARHIANATCNLSDFISFRVDSAMAAFMNRQDSIQGLSGSSAAQPGNIAILVGMHVATKEVANWTWQSFYWTPDPEDPGTPSSKLAAKCRPKELVGAAAHYAAVAAYCMVTPYGATNSTPGVGSMFGYNPYLEGGFGPGVFGDSNKLNKKFIYGMQSNCMSCHALAVADTTTGSNLYTTDQYIDLHGGNPYFHHQVQLDFAWSVQTGLIYDTLPYWQWTKQAGK